MQIREECRFLFRSTGAKRWLNRPRIPRPNAVLPLSYSDDPKKPLSEYAWALDPGVLRLTERLSRRLTDEFPKDTRPSGFAGPSGVPGDFYSLLNVSGYGMDPLPLPRVDNKAFVKSLGLTPKIRPRDESWLKELIRLFFGHVAPANLHFRRDASTGEPFFTNDVQYRKLMSLKALKRIDHFLTLMTGGRAGLIEALNEYHALMIFTVNERRQPDAVILKPDGKLEGKERPVATEREARMGLFNDSVMADKRVFNDLGQLVEGHFAVRRRTVFGMAGIANYVLTAVMGCVRAVYTKRFAFTYKTTGPKDKEERISRFKYVIGSDVKSMDTTMPEWFFRFLLNELHKYWDERLVKMLERMLFAPFIVPPPWLKTPDTYDPVFGGSPLDPESFDLHPGLPSGIAINPDLGKLWMTFVYVILYRDAGALRSVSEIEPFLRGANPDHALLDMADDAALLTNVPHVRDYLMKAPSPYAVLEPEVPVIFLGDVFSESENRKRAFPNPVTYIQNILCREDSIHRISPTRWAEGTLARFQQYSPSPIFRDMNAIYEEEVRAALGVNPILIARALARTQRFSDVDALVKANPHYLHYRVDPNDVSPEVLDELVATIPHEDFYDDIKHLFKANTQEA